MSVPVSVIIPCYRCADTIGRALDSVHRQTSRPKEVLLIEDCSDDQGKTIAALRNLQQLYQGDFAVEVIVREQNGGPGEARNTGWERARQPYIAFLDADDSWHPDKLRIQYQWMVEHPKVVMSGHQSTCQTAAAPLPPLSEARPARQVHCGALLLRNLFPTRSVMLLRALPHRFTPGKRYAEDYLLWLQLVCGGGAAWRIELPLASSHRPEFLGGLSGRLWAMEKGELDTYNTLRREGRLAFFTFVLLGVYSLLKFARRAVMAIVATVQQKGVR